MPEQLPRPQIQPSLNQEQFELPVPGTLPSTRELGERRNLDFEVVTFKPDESGFSKMALVHDKEGSTLDWDLQKWARPHSGREVLIETASGNTYVVNDNEIIDMNRSREAGKVVSYNTDEVPPVEVGKSWDVTLPDGSGFTSTKINRVLVGYKVTSGQTPETNPNAEQDPFDVYAKELNEIEEKNKATGSSVVALSGIIDRVPSTRELGERRNLDFEVVTFKPDESGFSKMALVHDKEGSTLDWDLQKWARPHSGREVLIETASGNTYVVNDNEIIDMNRSREAGKVVSYNTDEVPPVEVGKSWDVTLPDGSGFTSTKINRVLVGYKVTSGQTPETNPNAEQDPFDVYAKELNEIEEKSKAK